MLFVRILNFFRGMLVIRIVGDYPERFVNICTHRGINLWNVRIGSDGMYACIAAADFCRLRPIAHVTASRVRIARRIGMPFLLRRYGRRLPALIGAAAAAVFIWYTSTHILSISISGNDRIPEDRLLSELAETGIKIGTAVKNIEPDYIRNSMMIKDGDIAWLGINIKGSRIYIEITERLDYLSLPHITDEECNLVAARDGVITRTEIKQGQSMIKIGDGVREGDILVSGITDSVYGGYRLVHSYGEVYAETEYKAERTYSQNTEERIYTGNVRRFVSIDIFGGDAPLYTDNMLPDGWEETESEYVLRRDIFGKEAEVGYTIHEFREYYTRTKKLSLSEVIEAAETELSAEAEAQIPEGAEIITKTADNSIADDGGITVNVTYKCSENIAKESVIDKSLIDKTD